MIAITPSAVTSPSGNPGAPTVSPLASIQPWCGNVRGAGCSHRDASTGAVERTAVSNVVAARNVSTGAPVGKQSRNRWSGAGCSIPTWRSTRPTPGATRASTATTVPEASVRTTRSPRDARRVARPPYHDRHDRVAGIVGHRIEVVRVAEVVHVFDRGQPGELPVTGTDPERAVGVHTHREVIGSDLAAVVFVVGRCGGGREVHPLPSERGDVGDHELDVERGQILEHAHAGGIVGPDHARGYAVDGVAGDGRRRDRQRVDVLRDVGHEEHGEAVERDADDVGPRERRRVEHRVLELGAARHPAFDPEPGEPFEGAAGRLHRQFGRAREAGVHLPVHLVLRAAADGVVGVVREQRAPRAVE